MPAPNHLKPRREKVFGPAQSLPLDRNAKARIMAYARGYNARTRQRGQHRGPLTRAFLEVLAALLWGFHNSRDGRCFPSYERIAERAECNRDTVYEAIKALEFANVLTWVNRLARIREKAPDLLGASGWRWRVIRTSNAYTFRDPLPCADRPSPQVFSESENPAGTQIPESYSTAKLSTAPAIDPVSAIGRALERLGRAIEGRSVAIG